MSLFTCLFVRKLICIFLLCFAFSNRLYGQQQPQSPGQFFGPMPAQPFGQQPPLGSGGQQPPTPNNFQSSAGVQVSSLGAAGVKIVTDLMPYEKASHTLEVNWHEPYNYALYCVGQAPAQDLRFVCPTCGQNNTANPLGAVLQVANGRAPFLAPQQQAQVDQLLFQYTKDMTSLMQYPVIKLSMLPITGEVWDKQRIQCVGYYPGAMTPTGLRPNVTADTLISVQYVGKPQILDQLDRRPLFPSQVFKKIYRMQDLPLNMIQWLLRSGMGKFTMVCHIHARFSVNKAHGLDGQPSRFYIPQNAVVNFKCMAKASPAASSFEWYSGSNRISNQQVLQIPSQSVVQPTPIACRATNTVSGLQAEWKSSEEVLIEQLIGPVVNERNFESAVHSGVKDPRTDKVNIGPSATVTLTCQAMSSSKPYVFWFHQPAPGRILNASCDGGSRDSPEQPYQIPVGSQGGQGPQQPGQPQKNLVSVTSTCPLTFDTFTKAGVYWCLACSYIAENATTCDMQNTNLPPTGQGTTAVFELQGTPYIAPGFKVERFANSKQITFTFTYCGDPLPKPNEMYFLLDDERLHFNERFKSNGIFAGSPTQNQTFIRCQDVPLTFDSTKAAYPVRQVSMHIEPADRSYQPVMQSFYIRDALTAAGQNAFASPPFDSTALAAGLSVGLAILVALILTAYCWYKKCLCFSGNGRPMKTAKMGGLNVGMGVKPTKYQPGIPSSHLRPEGPEKVLPLTRSSNGFERPSKTPHEGMTYSEFDLVKDSNRLVPGSGGRIEYSRMPSGQPVINPASIKSPTNSIV